MTDWRTSGQPLMPVHYYKQQKQGYNIYPVHELAGGTIKEGYSSLADWILAHRLVLIDGYAGILWPVVEAALQREFDQRQVNVCWHRTKDLEKPVDVTAFTGKPGEVWGTRCTLSLTDFFDTTTITPDGNINIVIGTGAALMNDTAPVLYLEVSKAELQYRMRAGAITNLGSERADSPAEMYKRFYFVDWVVLNKYKESLKDRISIFADTQWYDTLTWITAEELKNACAAVSKTSFRVRPWFEPGAWGGQWMKEHIAGLNKAEVNYAWSFELIVPENGLLLGADGIVFELPFEWLMYYQHNNILGKHAHIFKYEFPIRFDFLDTFDGGNLSIQCHPSLEYIRKNFGEIFTQDETYYILDCKDDAAVYLGFQPDIQPAAFRKALETSQETGTALDIEQYVQKHPAHKHDLFLIPNSTVHSAGANNMVLEISATPYIFTFKMYDWVRAGLDGQPRPINITHAFNNLDFTRRGEQLISKPLVIEKCADWQVVQLPTHAEHFYEVQRLEFDTEIVIQTNDKCLVLMLVEGSAISVIDANGNATVYQYAETFVIPAAAKMCLISNTGKSTARLIKACLKDDHHTFNSIYATSK